MGHYSGDELVAPDAEALACEVRAPPPPQGRSGGEDALLAGRRN